MEGRKDVVMKIKIIGAFLVMAGSGGFGMVLVASHKAELKALRQLISVLDYMECELQYRLTPLPLLCRQASLEISGPLREIFLQLCKELEDQISPDVSRCMHAAVSRCRNIPKLTEECLLSLGQTLGRFDLQGQLSGLEAVRKTCRSKLESMERNKEMRLRGYQTLCLCAGAALAILLI